MDELIKNIHLLKKQAIELKDIAINYPIKNEQDKIALEIANSKNELLNKEYQNWLKENEEYLTWIINICEQLDTKWDTLSENSQKNLEILIQFLTKYSSIYNKISEEVTRQKIKNQINDLYKSIFNTANSLIGTDNKEYKVEENFWEENEPLEIEKKDSLKIINNEEKPISFDDINPYFIEEEPINFDNVLDKIKKYAILNDKNMLEVEKEFFKDNYHHNNETSVNIKLKDNFKVSLHSNLYETEFIGLDGLDSMGCGYYNPDVLRQVKALGIKIKDKIKVANLKSEVDKYLKDGGQIISVLAVCNNIIEGWYSINDIIK